MRLFSLDTVTDPYEIEAASTAHDHVLDSANNEVIELEVHLIRER